MRDACDSEIDPERLDIHVIDGNGFNPSRIHFDKSEGFAIGVYCLLFCDPQTAASAEKRMRQVADAMKGRHIILLAFTAETFCSENPKAWVDFCSDWAQSDARTGAMAQQASTYGTRVKRAIERWVERLRQSARILILTPDDTLGQEEPIPTCAFTVLGKRLARWQTRWFPGSPESYDQGTPTIRKNKGLATWALGSRFRESPDLRQGIQACLTPSSVEDAFDAYLKTHATDLMALAERVEDRTQEYREAIKARCARDAGWLWTESDLGTAVRSVLRRYRALEIIRDLCAIKGWLTLDDARARLLRTLTQDCALPLDLLSDRCAFIAPLAELLRAPGPLDDDQTGTLLNGLENNRPTLKAILHDPLGPDGLSTLRNALGPAADNANDATIRSVIHALPAETRQNRQTFVKAVADKISAVPREAIEASLAAMDAEAAKRTLQACALAFPEVARWLLAKTKEAR